MKRSALLTITSLVSILLTAVHLSDDIVRGFDPGGFQVVRGALILVVWLFGTLMLSERRSGYIIMLLGAILGSGIPLVHMRGAGIVGGRIAHSSGMLFWVWTIIMLHITANFSLILSVLGLWSFPWRRQTAKQVEGELA